MYTVSRFMFLGAIPLVAACGSTGGATGTAPIPVQVAAQNVTGAPIMSGVTMLVGSTGQKAIVGASRDAVWARLPAAYEALGIPLSIKDDAAFRLGNEQVRARRQLNGVQMRTIVDCGSDLSGEKAESYDIKLTIQTTVSPGATPDFAEIVTTVSALGRSASIGTQDVNCATRGELEKRIVRHVRAGLGLTEK